MSTLSAALPADAAGPRPDPRSDVELMLRLKHGHRESMDLLMRRHRDGVFGFLFRRIRNAAVAEDLTQETFLRMYLASGKYEAAAKFTTWLYRIATNLALNWVRDHRRDGFSDPIDDLLYARHRNSAIRVTANPERTILKKELRGRVRSAIGSLPERQRAAVVLHKYAELDYVEIGKRLECSESAVKSLMNRAFLSLRPALSDYREGTRAA